MTEHEGLYRSSRRAQPVRESIPRLRSVKIKDIKREKEK